MPLDCRGESCYDPRLAGRCPQLPPWRFYRERIHMAIDPYAACPGGTGKKIKFCCPDLVHELEKVQKMLDGEQRAACLEYIDSLESKFPDRACLLSVKAMLQAQLG